MPKTIKAKAPRAASKQYQEAKEQAYLQGLAGFKEGRTLEDGNPFRSRSTVTGDAERHAWQIGWLTGQRNATAQQVREQLAA